MHEPNQTILINAVSGSILFYISVKEPVRGEGGSDVIKLNDTMIVT